MKKIEACGECFLSRQWLTWLCWMLDDEREKRRRWATSRKQKNLGCVIASPRVGVRTLFAVLVSW